MGHPPAVVWQYTPRQMHAFLSIAARRRKREWKEMVAAQALGARGEQRELQRALKGEADE